MLAPYVLAFHLETRGLARAQQRDAQGAVELYDRAASIYRGFEEWHAIGKLELLASIALGDEGRLSDATHRASIAMAFLDAKRDPRLLLCALHNLVFFGAPVDAYQARADLEVARPYFLQHGRDTDLIRLEWCEARIAIGLRDHQVAARRFESVCCRFAAYSPRVDYAHAAVEGCEAHADAGDWGSVARLAHVAGEIESSSSLRDGGASWKLLADVSGQKLVSPARFRAAMNAVRGAARTISAIPYPAARFFVDATRSASTSGSTRRSTFSSCASVICGRFKAS